MMVVAMLAAASETAGIGVTGDFLNLLLGAGGAGFCAAAYKGIKDFRQGSWARQDGAVADLERWRQASDDAREWEAANGQYWRQRAGSLEHVIRTQLGADALPAAEPRPSRPDTAVAR